MSSGAEGMTGGPLCVPKERVCFMSAPVLPQRSNAAQNQIAGRQVGKLPVIGERL